MTERYDLSRRKLLAGLTTIGVAGAGAGLGTSAYFSDEESFENNMLTAGELDLAVDYLVHEFQGSAGEYTINSFTGEVNGQPADQAVTLNGEETAMSQQLTDVKPGDYGHSYFCFTIADNPAFMWACGELTASAENGYTEPEPEDDNGEGELEEAIQVDVRYCHVDETGTKTDTGETIMSGSLAEVLAALQSGVALDGTGDASATPGSQAPYSGTTNSAGVEGVDNPCICFEWEVPTEVGNEIQGDSLSFDLGFYAMQARHNDGSENPCGTPTSTGEGFAKVAENFNGDGTTSGGARARFGNNGASGAWELAAGDEPGTPGEFAQANYVWTSGATVDWSLVYDASSDELSFTFDGTTVTDTLDDPQPDGRIALQGKADEATVEAAVSGLSIDGASQSLSGPTSVTATNDGSGRQVGYLLIETALDGSSDVELDGTATVTLQGDYPGGDEAVAFDVVLE